MATSVLVTGGAGFIGSHVVDDLVRAGYRVTVFDNFSSGLRENLAALDGDVEIVEGDVLDAQALHTAARGKDDHFASSGATRDHQVLGRSARRYAHQSGRHDQRSGSRAAAGVERVINASSACIYGQAVDPPSDEDAGPHDPNWSYGASKLAAEKYAQIFSNDYGFPVSSLRYGITYGPREWYGRVLTIFLKRLSEGKPPVVFGAGEQLRDFVYVDDVVRIHRACMESGIGGSAIVQRRHRNRDVDCAVGAPRLRSHRHRISSL